MEQYSVYFITLKMTSVQVVETSVNNNSLPGDYSHPDDHNQLRTIYFIVSIDVLIYKHAISCDSDNQSKWS